VSRCRGAPLAGGPDALLDRQRVGLALGKRVGLALGKIDCWAPFAPGLFAASHNAELPRRIAHRIHPSAVAPTPTYFRPDAAITNVMTGRT